MEYYLVTVGRHSGSIWFRNDIDYIVGMNYIALTASETSITILAFVLMSNHIHIVLACRSEQDAKEFVWSLKHSYSMYMHTQYGEREFLRHISFDIRELECENESIERAIAYVHMNPVAANLCQFAALYPWGTGNSFFNSSPKSGRRLGDLSIRQQKTLVRSHKTLPEDFILNDSGYICPESFVDVAFCEKLFRTPKRYNYFLLNSSKVKNKTAVGGVSAPLFRDQILQAVAEELCESLCGVRNLDQLSPEQLAQLLRQLKWRFSSDAKQLARITGRKEELILNILEDFH